MRKKKEEADKAKEFARLLFTRERLTQKECAQRAGVSERTMGKWVQDEKWEMQRAALSITREQQLTSWYQQINAINEDIATRGNIPTTGDTDKLNKIASCIEKLEKETGIKEIISVGSEFLNFSRREFPTEVIRLSDQFDAFVRHKLASSK